MGLKRTVHRDQRHGVADPGPGLAREYEVGRQVEATDGALCRTDRERDADRRGPGGQRRGGGPAPFRQKDIAERLPFEVDRYVGGDLGDAVQSVIPAIARKAAVGLEQAGGGSGAFGGAP